MKQLAKMKITTVIAIVLVPKAITLTILMPLIGTTLSRVGTQMLQEILE